MLGRTILFSEAVRRPSLPCHNQEVSEVPLPFQPNLEFNLIA
jgi:hypothetical protein